MKRKHIGFKSSIITGIYLIDKQGKMINFIFNEGENKPKEADSLCKKPKEEKKIEETTKMENRTCSNEFVKKSMMVSSMNIVSQDIRQKEQKKQKSDYTLQVNFQYTQKVKAKSINQEDCSMGVECLEIEPIKSKKNWKVSTTKSFTKNNKHHITRFNHRECVSLLLHQIKKQV